MRTVGPVTAVVTRGPVASERAPISDETNALLPCRSLYGWYWSKIHCAWKPAA
jgi:hypothetical protein